MLKGSNKKDYQKEYMRKKREAVGLTGSNIKNSGSNKRVKPTGLTGTKGSNISKEEAIKLLKICSFLDRQVHGISGESYMPDVVFRGNQSMRHVRDAILSAT